MKKLSRDEILLLVITSIFTLANGMATVFMNVYLYSFTESLVGMATFTIFRIGMFPVMFILNGKIFKKSKLGYPLAAGLSMMTLSYVLLLNKQDAIAANPMLIYVIATIFGSGEGSYYFTVNNLTQLATKKETRGIYISVSGTLAALANIIAPFVSSLLISYSLTDVDGYFTIFRIVIVLYITISIVALNLQTKAAAMPFTLMDKFLLKVDKQWNYLVFGIVFNSLRDCVTLCLTGLLVYRATSGSGSLYSQLLTLFAVLSIIAYTIAGKVVKRNNRMFYYSAGALLLSSSTLVLALVPNIYGALYFGLVNAFAAPFYSNPYTIILMNALQDYQQTHNLVGFVIAKECLISLSRVIGMGTVLLFACFLDQDTAVVVTTVLTSLCPIIQTIVANIYHAKRDRAKKQMQ